MAKSKISIPDLKDFLDEKSNQYENLDFIEDDPILVPHSFTKKEDIEISGFITSVISWGNRKSIIKSAKRIIEFMDNSPYDFIINHSERDLFKTKESIHLMPGKYRVIFRSKNANQSIYTKEQQFTVTSRKSVSVKL